jgi:hypothetical protein
MDAKSIFKKALSKFQKRFRISREGEAAAEPLQDKGSPVGSPFRKLRNITQTCLIILLIASSASAYGWDRARPRFFNGKLWVSPVPLAGQRVKLNLDVTALADNCRSATIQFRTPAGVELLSRDIFQRQYLARDVSYQYSAEIVAIKKGSYALQATVYFQLPDGRQKAEHFFIYISIGDKSSQISYDGPFPPLETKSEEPKPAPSVFPHGVNNTTEGISGRITYYDDNLRQEVPIKHIEVRLLEQLNRIQTVDWTYTDDDGYYYIDSVSNAELHGETGRNMWLCVAFENEALEISDSSDRLYTFDSFKSYAAPGGQIRNDLFMDSRNQYRALGHIFNCVMDAYNFTKERLDWYREQVPVQWPMGGGSKYGYVYSTFGGLIFEEYIHIGAGSEWYRSTILHEYGHAVMTGLYDYAFYDLPESWFINDHWLYTVSDTGFAMKEGWAEFFEAVVDDNAYNLTGYINAPEPNIESNDWWTGDIMGEGSNTQGEVVEGSVASILWDIADTSHSRDGSPGEDDDGIDGMLDQLWELVKKHKPENIIEFWDFWIQEGYGQIPALYSIYLDHGVNVVLTCDMNLDGNINIEDLSIIAYNFGKKVSQNIDPSPDINRDGKVDIFDLIICVNNMTRYTE